MTNPEPKRRMIRLTLSKHPVLSGVLALLFCTAGIISYLLHHQLMDSAKASLATSLATEYATRQRLLLNSYVDQQVQQLQTLSQDDLFVNALAAADPAMLTRMEQRMKKLIADLNNGYLLLPGDARLTETNNFIGQQLSRQVVAGETPQPVAAKVGEDWELLFAYPVKNAEGVILGSLLAILSIEPLTKALAREVDPALGTTELLQQIPGAQARPFLAVTNKSKTVDAVIQNTRINAWQLGFTGSTALLNRVTPSYMEFLLLTGAVVGITLLLAYLAIRIALHRGRRQKRKHRVSDKPPATKTVTPVYETFDDTTATESTSDELQQPPTHDTESGAPDNHDSHTDHTESNDETPDIPTVVFRDYDIRGLAGSQLTPAFALSLGKALARRAMMVDEHTLITGYDGRQSSPQLIESLEEGIRSTGCNVIHLGAVPTPLLNFATNHLQQTECGVMVTASHNPAHYNGFKIFFQHHALCGPEIAALRTEMMEDYPDKPHGERQELDIASAYIQSITSDVVPAQHLKVVLDAGNGIAGELASRVLEAIGCDVIPLYCDVDGSFPNHAADPTVPENLVDLIAHVKDNQANLGVALDGDGDRIVAISASGRIIWPDELLMIFARDVVSRHPGADVVFDIKSTRRLNTLISSYGGRPVMWKTGHSHMYNKIIESKAPLGGEFSGHIFFQDRWFGFDDGIYAAARLIEIMSIREQGLDEIVAGFEERFATPEIRIEVGEQEKFTLIEKLLEKQAFQAGKISTIDGIRVDFPKAWGLVRASNTGPALTLRFEAESQEALEKIKSLFRQQLRSIDDRLSF
ncbi:phosphomannomutase/phosphoglucomutase [Porticoccus sp.]|uniref:phosphomannomutase/phosphoglucomutase n=1 Tax=Porticoccus sp. TaxID=2024853 RepID=UPI003F69A8CB